MVCCCWLVLFGLEAGVFLFFFFFFLFFFPFFLFSFSAILCMYLGRFGIWCCQLMSAKYSTGLKLT